MPGHPHGFISQFNMVTGYIGGRGSLGVWPTIWDSAVWSSEIQLCPSFRPAQDSAEHACCKASG
eukprot:11261611-Karenia_brevis.AAC.1